ncbi:MULTISPECIES: winged helix-turn-helix domain-containing protein [Providencia]|uniref:OmpR/PhoB-type domain-containing protein n=2 Tax=Providencia TaxID=586 RepID=A0AAI9MWU8_PROST|nr:MULTISPECIES: hypothetical protein [Providencia]ELR5046474.1 hypothetical protein [Providencia rettgeri]ELR5036294.1 hypothetical protein [Providencia stuartii]ELR5292858.1 hypothetical protein [Providencia stuartii]ELZ5940484.1 hypothetical protein [Providencia stuartii]MCR4181537.1 hypothetical protein [Providencia vermicola]
MNKTDQIEQEPLIILSEYVVYNPLKRTLSRGKKTINLSENESCLLKLLLNKTSSKREIMYEIWEKRGTIVTESSYYKLVRQLRLSFKKIELDENLIMTLPRVGILYTGTKSEANQSMLNYQKKGIYSYVQCFFNKLFNRTSL